MGGAGEEEDGGVVTAAGAGAGAGVGRGKHSGGGWRVAGLRVAGGRELYLPFQVFDHVGHCAYQVIRVVLYFGNILLACSALKHQQANGAQAFLCFAASDVVLRGFYFRFERADSLTKIQERRVPCLYQMVQRVTGIAQPAAEPRNCRNEFLRPNLDQQFLTPSHAQG